MVVGRLVRRERWEMMRILSSEECEWLRKGK
jgi:hypothetical protein